MKGIVLQDGKIRTYIGEFYTAKDDRQREIWGACIIGYIEACFELGEWVEEHLREREEK